MGGFKKENVMGLLLRLALVWALGGLILTGCSSKTGWRVSFGVAPVKQLDDRQGLTQEKGKNGNLN